MTVESVVEDETLRKWSWHDIRIHGISFQSDLPQHFAKLRLDIDVATDSWLDSDNRFAFMMAPATATFENVSKVDLAAESGNYEAGHMVIIESTIEEDPLPLRPANPHFKWKFVGEWFTLSFSTTGAFLWIRREPAMSNGAWLSPEEHGEVCFAEIPYDA